MDEMAVPQVSAVKQGSLWVCWQGTSQCLLQCGPIEHQALHPCVSSLRRCARRGAFRPARLISGQSGIAPIDLSRFGSDIINARLQAAIQRRSDAFDAIVIDELVAAPYLPVNAGCPVYYLAHRCEADLGCSPHGDGFSWVISGPAKKQRPSWRSQ